MGASAEQHTLQPVSGAGRGFTVTVDQPSVPSVRRLIVLPEGTTLSVSEDHGGTALVTLIGPGGVESFEESGGKWSQKLTEPGGYKLQYGSPRGQSVPAQIDLVITNEPRAVASMGTDLADALYSERP